MVITDIKKRNLWQPLTATVLALFYTLPFLLRINYWGVRDWDLFTTIAAVPVGSLLDFGQFPFWNMYMGGGNILFHHPEVLVLSPFFVLYLVFGAVVGLKLQVFLCYVIGFWGTLRMARRLELSQASSVMVAVAYFGSVHFALHFAEGHMPFTHFCFLPWVFYFLLDTGSRLRAAVGSGVCLALMILGNGAAIPLLYTLTFCGLYFSLVSLANRTWRPLNNLVLGVITGFGLAAVKLVPMVIYLVNNRWEGEPHEAIPLGALNSIFFGWDHSLFARNFTGQQWAWHEYGAYLSPLLVILAVVPLAWRWRRFWPWLMVAALFLALGLGDFGPWSPWTLLAHLPGFSSARCTGRAFQFVLLSGAVLGGFGLDIVRTELQAKSQLLRRGITIGVVMLVVGTNLILAWPIMTSAFTRPPVTVERQVEFRHVVTKLQAYENFLANRGSLITPWLSAYQPSRALVDPANNTYLEHVLSGDASVVDRVYTPNRIEYRLDVLKPGQMVISMGYDQGWSAEDGRELSPSQRLISFDILQGRDVIVLTYRPPYLLLGLTLSGLTLLLLGWLCKRYRLDSI
ncbi:MAG: hypothetical protein ABIE70_08975 [bacterium]